MTMTEPTPRTMPSIVRPERKRCAARLRRPSWTVCPRRGSCMAGSLGPKLCLGPHLREALLRCPSRKQDSTFSGLSDEKRSFSDVRSQAELGTEKSLLAWANRLLSDVLFLLGVCFFAAGLEFGGDAHARIQGDAFPFGDAFENLHKLLIAFAGLDFAPHHA